MAGSIERLVADLRRFDRRKVLTKELRAELRKPVPKVRRAIKARALATMPKRGGLNVWVSKTRITASVKLTGRGAGVRLRGARRSTHRQSDVNAIDRGRVRHPSWGRRGLGQWHNQLVRKGFFTAPTVEVDQWRAACLKALDDALEVIRRG